MQLQINILKNALNQLVISPGIHYAQDDHFSQLQAQLDAEFDAIAVEKKVNRLSGIIDKLEKKKIRKN